MTRVRRHRTDLLSVLCAMLIAALVTSVVAAPGFRLSLSRKIVDRLDRLTKISDSEKQLREMRALLMRHFDFETFEASVLQDVSSSFTKEQSRRFSKAFRELFVNYLVSKLREAPSGWSPKSCTVTDGAAADVVSVKGTYGKSDFEALVYWGSAKSKRVTDVSVSGALLSRNYRAMVNKNVREHGVDGLILRLRRKKASLERAPAEDRHGAQTAALQR